jgi:hypothetical protein
MSAGHVSVEYQQMYCKLILMVRTSHQELSAYRMSEQSQINLKSGKRRLRLRRVASERNLSGTIY